MNLLPKSHQEFSQKDYWNKFFKKRGNKAFEWYGEYLELCSHLHKYLKPKDSVLIPGCGNSSLSADLYDVGYTNLTNIDLSEVVIKQMTRLNAHRSNMKFIFMDALRMSFENEEFNVVLDKGTLDALMPDDSEETVKRIDQYFSEIKRVLKFGGRFVCVSLLQSHIFEKLLSYFGDRSWMIRVVRCHEAEEKNAIGHGTALPVFVVVATKFKEMPRLILEVCMAGDKMVRLETKEEMMEYVKSVQDTAFVTNGISKSCLDGKEEVSLDLLRPGEDTPRYTLFVLDQKIKNASYKYAVFVVPQGRESEWLFGTPTGRLQLQQSAKSSRLVVAILHRDHQFETLDAVKEELTHSAKMLIPPGWSGQILFLSVGSDVGRRRRVCAGRSPSSGAYVVEDVDVEHHVYRRLVFLDNQFLVQSEAKLKTIKRKCGNQVVIDFGDICTYHSFMCVGARLAAGTGPRAGTAAVLGLGGGALCMFLRKCLEELQIVAVDIDPEMLEIAQKHFGLKLDDKLTVQIKDGLHFLQEEAEKGSKFSMVMFDMDNKDTSLGLSCPPAAFLESDTLRCVANILADDGHFILNLVCRDTELRDATISTLKQHFKHLVTTKLYEDVNEIIFGTNGDVPYTAELLEEAAKSLNGDARNKKLVTIKCADIKDFLQSINIIS